jgi:hypothetical protein
VHEQPVVEVGRTEIANVGLDGHRFDAVRPERRVAASKAIEVVNARDLEPNEVFRVVRDALRVCLGEADSDLGVEVEAVDGEMLKR